jgi:AraC family transcriptional regulator
VTLSAVAGTVGIHPAHLARVFRTQFHCTIGEYVRKLRLDDAARRLGSSEDSIKDIAIDAGFYDQSHFTNAFRRHTGVTPARFRGAIAVRNGAARRGGSVQEALARSAS